MLENNICNVSYIELSLMSIIIRCCLILCYLFIFVIIMLVGGIYHKLLNLISFLFPNIYISSCITCLYVYKLEIKFDLIRKTASIVPFLEVKQNGISITVFHLSDYISTTFTPCSRNFTSLQLPQFIISHFPLKNVTTKLRSHSTGIPNLSTTQWHNSTITWILTLPLNTSSPWIHLKAKGLFQFLV